MRVCLCACVRMNVCVNEFIQVFAVEFVCMCMCACVHVCMC